MEYSESIVIGAKYSGAADVQDNSDRFSTDRGGLLVDQGDGRIFVPVAVRALALVPGDAVVITYADTTTETVVLGEIDRLDDSFSFMYDA